MRILFWTGLAALILGIGSLFIPIPRQEREGLKVGGVSIGVETRHEEKVSPIVGAVMILGGAGMMIAGRRKA
jgi:hypothetical protein